MSLYICPTPIGNLEDITIRVINTLKKVDFIACEDTRVTKKLLSHYMIEKPLINYDDYSDIKNLDLIIKYLKEGKDIALVSDAGTPLINDPGIILIKKCIKENIDVMSLPGANAITTALASSGFETNTFSFYGFLPKKKVQRIKLLESLKDTEHTIIFYESANRLIKSIDSFIESFYNFDIVIARELTKIYEEYIRGDKNSIKDILKDKTIKGEIVILLKIKKELKEVNIKEELKRYLEKGYTKKDAINIITKEFNLSKNRVYKEAIDK